VGRADEKLALAEVTLIACSAAKAAVELGHRLARLRFDPGVRPKAQHGDVRLVAVLLEEHPLQHLRPFVPVLRQVLGALTEVDEDRVRLGSGLPSSSTSVGTRRPGFRSPSSSPARSGR